MDSAEKTVATMPALLEKLSVLDKWLNTRIEQTRAAEQRMDQKLQQLSRLEGSLSTMLEGLRRQMADAGPIIQSAGYVADTARQQAQNAVDSVIADALASARQQANALAHELSDRIEAQVAEKIEQNLASVSVERLASISAEVQLQLAEEATRCRERAEQTLVIFRQVLAQQVERVVDEARAATEPHLARIGDTRDAVDREITGILDAAVETVQQRLDGLARSANASAEMLERKLVERVRMIRPQVMAEVESTQKLIAHRVAGLIEASRKMVGGVVNELDQKLDAVGPKADALREQMDEKLAEFLKEVETEASTMLTWLEDRITARVDDLVDVSRRSMHNEIRTLDDARHRLSRMRPANPMPANEHPNEPLQLSMYLHRAEPTEPKPAA